MRVAIPSWNDRISPVFDVANEVHVFTVEGGIVTDRSQHRLANAARIATMSAIGVDVLICSAISRTLEAALWVAGIEVVSEVCGPVEDVVKAYLKGMLADASFLTPARSGHAKRGRAMATQERGDAGAIQETTVARGGRGERRRTKKTVT